MKCGRSLGLLLLLSLGAPSAQLFIPPGREKPAPSSGDSVVTVAVTAREVGTGNLSSSATPLSIDVEVEVMEGTGTTPAATQATVTVTDTPTTQPLKIEIDMENVAAQAGETAEPMWHVVKISGGADANGSAVTGLPPPPAATKEVEEVLVRLTPATEETLSNSMAGSTAFSPSSTTPTSAPKGASRPVDQPEPTGMPGQAQQQQLKKGHRHKEGESPTKLVKQQSEAEEGGEPEKPKPANTSRKSKPSSPDKEKMLIVEEGEGTLPPLSITETSQVYLLIKEVDVDSNEFQRETEIPVTSQILTTDIATSAKTIITQFTGTTVSSIVSETDETVINIDDKGIRIEEKVEKTITSNPEFKEMYIEQLVDHFSFSAHQKTYRQRYLITGNPGLSECQCFPEAQHGHSTSVQKATN
ncbi:uncharacterized protein [Mobula birostris]|uniref:uncharacterized protein n=1 Tax=Mobula birostris TaxID=1983395 RepID=UPI003B287711